MTPQQKDLMRNALQDGLLGCISAENSTTIKRDLKILNNFQDNIHEAIKELEAMPTEEVK